MKEIKNDLRQERRKYVPASLMVITASMQGCICTSVGDPWNTDEEEIG